jgi:hypothetical protein
MQKDGIIQYITSSAVPDSRLLALPMVAQLRKLKI